jgi:hypothetical protein
MGEKDRCFYLYPIGQCWSAFAQGKKTTVLEQGEVFILPAMREAMEQVIAANAHHAERARAMLEKLNGEIARPMEPTYDELNPPPPVPKEYKLSLGDSLYIGTQQYELLSLGDEEVTLFDPSFPLFHQTYPRQEFFDLLKENPMNDKYLREIEAVPEVEEPAGDVPVDVEVEQQLSEEAEPALPIGRIEYLHTDGRVREQIEYTDIAEMEADLRADNFDGVPMKVTMYADRQGKTVPHGFVYEMDPPLHGTAVIMNPHIQGGLETPMEKAMRLRNFADVTEPLTMMI